MGIFIFIYSLLMPVAWGVSPACFLPSVKKVIVPVYPDRSGSANFTYRFQYFPPATQGAPTIIVIPGGPGVGLIENWTEGGPSDFGLPEDAGVMFLDPRTVDCNEGDEKLFPDDALTTEYLAHDILAAVKKLKLKNFILYGHSYGSVLATVTAGLAEKMGIRPQAVVLTGVVGKWVEGVEGSVYWALKTEWAKLKQRLPDTIVERFARADMPLGIPESEWSDIVENGLYLGRIYRQGKLFHPLYESLILLAKNTARADQKALQILAELRNGDKLGKSDDDHKWSERLFEVIDCAELTNTEPTTTLKNGEIVITGDDCTNRATLIRPYDSKNYLTTAPTFYFTGTAEAVTFYEQARIHFERYELSDRFFVTIPGGSHNRIGLYFPDCKEALWEAIEAQGQGFQEVLMSCRASGLMCASGGCQTPPFLQFLPGKQFTAHAP